MTQSHLKKIGEVSKRDPIISNVIDFVLCEWPSKVNEQLPPYFCCRNELAVESSYLRWRNKVVIPFQLREKILTELHENQPGIVTMKALVRSYVWWPNMDNEIEMTVKSCKSCQMNQAIPAKAPIHPWQKTTAPGMRIHIDFAGPFVGKMFLIIYDSYSKWIDAIPMINITSSAVIDRLGCTFSVHGIPYFIVSDNGPLLASQEFNTFCRLNGINHLTIAPYHPSSNSAAERLVQTFKTSLKKIIEGKEVKELNTILQRFLLAYHTTPHCKKTHTSPAELLFNRKLNTRLNFVKPTLTDTITSHEDNFCRFHYYSRNLLQFYPGDRVWIRDYGKVNTKWIEGQVVKKISDVMYDVKLD